MKHWGKEKERGKEKQAGSVPPGIFQPVVIRENQYLPNYLCTYLICLIFSLLLLFLI
jgi:hypothetical protein